MKAFQTLRDAKNLAVIDDDALAYFDTTKRAQIAACYQIRD
jgi:hypothetical protein